VSSHAAPEKGSHRLVFGAGIIRRIAAAGVACISGVLTLVVSACGLPTISYLAPPTALSPDGINNENSILRFTHNGENDGDDFRGYELYYKLYLETDTSIDTDETEIEETPRETGPGRLEANDFVRLAPTQITINGELPATVTDDSAPLLPLEPTGTAVEFSLDLRTPDTRNLSDENTHIVVTWTDGSNDIALELRRRSTSPTSVSDPLNDYEGFWDGPSYLASDYDTAQMFNTANPLPSPPGRLVIVLYVISYGIDANDFNPYYSEPVRLEPAVLVTG